MRRKEKYEEPPNKRTLWELQQTGLASCEAVVVHNEATTNKCIATRNKGIGTSNKGTTK